MPAPLVQRDSELAALDRRLARVRGGEGLVVVVEGPAGIGKSCLLRATAQRAAGSGVRVLGAVGGPLEQEAGWGIVRQLFASVRNAPEWGDIAVGAAALAAAALDPAAAAQPAGADLQHATSHGLTWLASNLADRAATLLVVDDAQWADVPSLRWLAQLSRHIGGMRLGVLCAVRSGEPASEPGLLAELLAAAPDPAVRPTPLAPESVALLVSARFGAADPGFAVACHDATDGNPFLVGALLERLQAEGVHPSAQVAAALDTFGVEQVARSVERRLARLPAGATELARAVVVLGQQAPLRHAARLAGVDSAAAATLADRLCEAELLRRDDGGYAVAHPLLAAAIAAGMPPAERAVRHREAAALLAAERADLETLALHLLRSDPVGDAWTVEMLRGAAEGAVSRGAPETAAALLRRALAEPPATRTLEADLRSELGLILAGQVRNEGLDELRSAVRLADSPEQRARIALAGARALGLAAQFPEAVELGRRALADRDGIPPDLVARLEAELACVGLMTAETFHEAARLVDKARAAPAPSSLWLVDAACLGVAQNRPVREVCALLDTALASAVIASESGTVLETAAILTQVECGDLDAAESLCCERIEAARAQGWFIALVHGTTFRAYARVRAGRIRDAEADARFSFQVKLGASRPEAVVWAVIPLVDALIELDELAAADTALDAAGLQGEPQAGAFSAMLLLESRARLRLAQGRPAAAHADLRAAAEGWPAFGATRPGLAEWRVHDAAALLALGDASGARRLAAEHLDVARRIGHPAATCSGLRAVATTSELREAIGLLEQAVRVVEGSPAGLEHTRALVDLGAALRRANRRADCREPLRLALDLAERGGMRRLADRARHELQAAGARPRRTAISGLDALTPAEYQVAALAAQGSSNPEIAQQLFVTRRTVETHLTHAFQKLGVTTRAALADHWAAAGASA